MKTAVIFAGQGSQNIGMGKDFYQEYEIFRNVFDNLTDEEKNIAWEGPSNSLADTENTQPILLAYGMGVYSLFKEEGIKFDIGAGLSLGEYTALCSANVWSVPVAVELVRFRARAMKDAAKGIDAGMCAVLGLDKEKVEQCCSEASSDAGFVSITNLNCPGQIVISGEKNAVLRAAELAVHRGAKRCLPLDVSGPFHTKYMQKAGNALKGKLAELEFAEPEFSILYNCIGKTKPEEESISNLLVKQVSTGVLMEDIIRNILKSGVDNIVEIGPGRVLAGFVKKIDKDVNCMSISSVSDFKEAVATLGK
ncbi:MAG: ACP S-malonyltransferase [Eubacteriales bacterium]